MASTKCKNSKHSCHKPNGKTHKCAVNHKELITSHGVIVIHCSQKLKEGYLELNILNILVIQKKSCLHLNSQVFLRLL